MAADTVTTSPVSHAAATTVSAGATGKGRLRLHRLRLSLLRPSMTCVVLFIVAMVTSSAVADAQPTSSRLSKETLLPKVISSPRVNATSPDGQSTNDDTSNVNTLESNTDEDKEHLPTKDEIELRKLAEENRRPSHVEKLTQRQQPQWDGPVEQDETADLEGISQLLKFLEDESSSELDLGDPDLQEVLTDYSLPDLPDHSQWMKVNSNAPLEQAITTGHQEEAEDNSRVDKSLPAKITEKVNLTRLNSRGRQHHHRVERGVSSITVDNNSDRVKFTAENMATSGDVLSRTKRELVDGSMWRDAESDYSDVHIKRGIADQRFKSAMKGNWFNDYNNQNSRKSDHKVVYQQLSKSDPYWISSDFNSDLDDGDSLAEYLDKLRRRRMRQRQPFATSARKKTEAAWQKQRELIMGTTHRKYYPIVIKGVKGVFVPQSDASVVDRSRRLRRWKPRQRKVKPYREWQRGSRKSTLLPAGRAQSYLEDNAGSGRRKATKQKSAVAKIAGQWTKLVRREVRRALDEYEKISRTAERIKAATKSKPFADDLYEIDYQIHK